MTMYIHRFLHGGQYFLCYVAKFIFGMCTFYNDHELVTPHSYDRIYFSQLVFKTFDNLEKHLISYIMSICIIDFLEIIDIYKN